MRILFITQWFEPEPGFSRGMPLAKSLVASGDEVEILTGFPNYPGGRIYPGYKMRLWQKERLQTIDVHRVPLYPSHDSSAVRRALNYSSFALSAATIGAAVGRGADVAYIYHGGSMVGLPALVQKTLRGTPFVYHIADMWPESVLESGMVSGKLLPRLMNKVLGPWGEFIYGRAARITVLSPGFKRLLIERGVDEQKIDVIYNWTDEDVFHPSARDESLAGELGLDGAFTVLYAGNIGAYQGIDTVLKAATLLKDYPAIQFVIVGTGQKEAEIRNLAAQLQTKNVRILGQQAYKGMAKFYSIADVLLIHLNDHAFFSTTIPGKTQVSLACGRPILMGVRGDAADVIRRADAGVVCEPQNAERMAEAVLHLYRLPSERLEQMGRNGRDFYLREMSLHQATRRMREIFQLATGDSFQGAATRAN